ncbi:MAG: hypothetical protein V1777_04565 [Candidatus Micrarchaeota archaeon]
MANYQAWMHIFLILILLDAPWVSVIAQTASSPAPGSGSNPASNPNSSGALNEMLNTPSTPNQNPASNPNDPLNSLFIPEVQQSIAKDPAVIDPNTGQPFIRPNIPAEIPLNQQQQSLLDVNPQYNPPSRTGFTCSNTELSPLERNKLWDETLRKGFVGKQIDAGKPAKKNRETLDQNNVIIPDEKGDLAIKQKIPNQKIDPAEIEHLLNNFSTGAFAFGLLVNDSVRAGRCLDMTKNCSVLGKNMELRNSGSGIVQNYKNVFSHLWNKFKMNDANVSIQGIPPSDLADVRASLLQVADTNQVPVQLAERIRGKIIPNSILTDSFSASMNSNCTNAACYINTYSMFDKMFNAYSSGFTLLSSFGPTFLNQAGRAFGYAKIRSDLIPKISDSALGKRIRSLYQRPNQFAFNELTKRNLAQLRTKSVMFDAKLVSDKAVLEGGQFSAWWNPTFQKELAPITDPIERGNVYNYVTNMKNIARSTELERQLAEDEFKAATKGLLATDPGYIIAKRKFAATQGKLWDQIDDVTGIDVPQWHLNHKSVDWQKYAVQKSDGEFTQLAQNSDFYDLALNKMAEDGHFHFDEKWLTGTGKKWGTSLTSVDGKLQLYTLQPEKSVAKLTKDALEEAIQNNNYAGAFAKLENGESVPFNKGNLAYILKKSGGDVELFTGKWQPARQLSADDLADLMMTTKGAKPLKNFANNLTFMQQVLREKGFQNREHWGSLLDQYFAKENQIIKSYLSPKGGAKLTAYPFAFWGFKRGFGQEAISLYQLPDTWKTLSLDLGDSDLYKFSYIDFFSNEGSDQGDIFVAFLNKLPWKVILDKLSQEYNPINDFYQSITHNEARSEVGSLAVYTSGPEDCSLCKISLQHKGTFLFSPFFFSPQKLQSFFLEDTPNDQKDIGQTLIAYASRTNLSGETKDIAKGHIDLDEAVRNKTTCQDLVKKMNKSIPIIGAVFPEDASVGGVLVGMETLGYAVFTWAGFLGSALQQTLLAPQLQDCVDAQEGYFIHFFSPAPQSDKKAETPADKSTNKVANAVKEGSDRVLGALKGDTNSWTGQAANDAKQKIDDLISNAETKDLVEGVLTTNGQTSGQFSGTHLFYLWLQGGSELTPSKYRTEGEQDITDGKINVKNDFKKGQVLVDGKPVITDPDITRFATLNSNIPAMEYPGMITKIGLPSDEKTIIFRMNVDGDTYVLHPQVLNCIREGVKAQTGVGMAGDNLSEVFGKTQAIVTDTHPQIFSQPESQRITAEGIPRKVADGPDSHADVWSDTTTELIASVDGDPQVGHMQSIQFQNGVILYNPQTNELLVWLKRNEKTILNQNQVQGLRATPTTSVNPENQCAEPAINLEALANPNSELDASKVAAFNQSLQNFGPYKIFDTPSKRFIFYSKLENGKCRDYFKVIDKNTGETLVDQPITSITPTPNGVKITTADGKEHTLDFSSEGGKPILTYNGQPEPLISAQGDKGAFWYDPNKGLWYTENAQLLPLLEAFKQNGLSTQVGPDGKVSTQATGNLLNLNIGGDKGNGFNLPSLPENPLLLALFILGLIGTITVIRTKSKKE